MKNKSIGILAVVLISNLSGCSVDKSTDFLTYYEAKALLQQGKAVKCYNPNNFTAKPDIIAGTSNLETYFIGKTHFLIQGETTANGDFCLKK